MDQIAEVNPILCQEISNGRTHERTDPEKTWVSNSSS